MWIVVDEQGMSIDIKWKVITQTLAAIVRMVQGVVPLVLKLLALILMLLLAPEIHALGHMLGQGMGW